MSAHPTSLPTLVLLKECAKASSFEHLARYWTPTHNIRIFAQTLAVGETAEATLKHPRHRLDLNLILNLSDGLFPFVLARTPH